MVANTAAAATFRWSVQVTVTDAGGTGTVFGFDVAVDNTSNSFEASGTVLGMPFDERSVRGVNFFAVPETLQQFSEHRPWCTDETVPTPTTNPPSTTPPTDLVDGVLDAVRTGNAQAALAAVARIGGPLTSVGSVQVRGVRTTRYSVNMPGSQVIGIDPVIPVEVEIDAQGRLRRLHLSASGLNLTGDTSPSSLTLEMYDPGAAISIKKPPDNQIAMLDPLNCPLYPSSPATQPTSTTVDQSTAPGPD